MLALRVFGTQERVELIKEQIGRGWKEPMTDAELEFIATVCQRGGYDPLARPPQVYFIKRWDSRLRKYVMSEQKAIDGTRLTAVRTREYAGQAGPQWTADGKEWLDVWLSDEPPAAARVGVLRKGFRDPIWSVATWREWAQYDVDERGNKSLSTFWRTKGAHMLAKTAESMSLKRAFPEETDEHELEVQEQRWREEDAELAQRYTEIFSAEDDVVVSGNRLVDRTSGEVVHEDEPEPDMERKAEGLL